MSEINKFKELLHQHAQVSFSCGEHHVPWEYAKFESRQRETERALVEWVEKREARIAELEAALADSNYWRDRHVADRDAYALRDERRFQYLRELHESGLIPLDVFVKFSRMHGVPDVKAK